jgi:hypothetical protein
VGVHCGQHYDRQRVCHWDRDRRDRAGYGINIGGICTITVDGPPAINGNTWSNTTHQLTINNAATIAMTTNPGCLGLYVSPLRLGGTFTLSASAIIT